jgi:hypothetical protein
VCDDLRKGDIARAYIRHCTGSTEAIVRAALAPRLRTI